MPDEDRFSLIRAIRAFPVEQGGKIPAIARDEDRHRAIEAGFDRYLTKPLDAEELIRTLLDLLQEER
ncbi:MAG: hypothetical protein KME18_26735 [Phormidium tanganyikae FI6-MK23]|jgi:hypothetical protein|nr:hypothetical protein [Phormidium tanganyikae FI6-MK23]